MATGQPRAEARASNPSWEKRFSQNWNSNFCAEHDGKIGSFRNLSETLDDIEDFEIIFKRESIDLVRVGTIAGAAVGGALIAAPVAIAAAPSLAAALGSAGLLGAAGTGTAIATLHGAALTSASLAAIGGGTMAGGVVIMTAAGAALGASQGAVVSNAYFGEVDGFKIRKLNEGSGPAILFVNGFLQQKEEDVRDWRGGLRELHSSVPWYHLQWESKRLSDIGMTVSKGGGGAAAAKLAAGYAKRAAKKAGSKLSPAAWVAIAADLAGNPWHTAMVRASMTGAILADLMARTRNQEFILMGHSLGARVIYYTLQALSTKSTPIVRDAYLFGGAVDRQDAGAWRNAASAVRGHIYNCWSSKDGILNGLYRSVNCFQSDPVGLGPIAGDSDVIRNEDFSDIVNGHIEWKSKLAQVLAALKRREEGKVEAHRTSARGIPTSRIAGPSEDAPHQCTALTTRGKRCRRPAIDGAYCWQHRRGWNVRP